MEDGESHQEVDYEVELHSLERPVPSLMVPVAGDLLLLPPQVVELAPVAGEQHLQLTPVLLGEAHSRISILIMEKMVTKPTRCSIQFLLALKLIRPHKVWLLVKLLVKACNPRQLYKAPQAGQLLLRRVCLLQMERLNKPTMGPQISSWSSSTLYEKLFFLRMAGDASTSNKILVGM